MRISRMTTVLTAALIALPASLAAVSAGAAHDGVRAAGPVAVRAATVSPQDVTWGS